VTAKLKNQRLNELSHTFSEFAVQIPQLIISETNLPSELRMLPPVDMGGIAGGVKVSCFRLSRIKSDSENFYVSKWN